MDEKVERSAEENNASRQVRRPVVSEPFLQSGQGIVYEANAIPPNLRPLILGKLNGGMRVANYSVQTGEEFALQFAQEASRSRRGLDMEQVPLQKINTQEANPYVYEDLTGLLGIGRVDSGTNSEISMLAAERGNMSDFGSHCNPVYPESLQGIQSSHFGNDGVYQMDEVTFGASTRQTKPQHMSHSIHRSYLSARSNDSSSGKMKFMSSYGGRILPRPSDGRLRYVGGDTRIISVNKDIGYEELMQKIIDIYGQVLILKYQLPGEDLDALVSVSSDEDLENMMEEYDKLDNNDGSARLRIFLFTLSDNDLAQFDAMVDKRYSELQYVDAVNGIPETSVRKYPDSLGSFSSHHLDNLIGLDGADNWNFNKRAEEGLDSLRAQVSKDGTKIVKSSSTVLSSSTPPVSNASFTTNPSTLSAPFSSLPMHVKHSVIADAPIHFKPEQINSHSYSVVRSPEGYNDIDCGRPISSDVFQHEVEYKFKNTESRTSPDSSTNRQNDFFLPSHSDSMYKGDGWVADTKVVQSRLNVRSDGLHPVEFQRIGKVPPPVHQPVWLHNFDGEQYSYKTTDTFPHSKSGEVYLQQPVQQHTVQNIHPIVLQTANHYPAVSKHSDQVHAHHDDMLDEGSQDTNSTNEPFHNVLKEVGSSPSSPCQGGGQLYGQVHQTRNAPYVDEQDSGTKVPPDNSQFNACLFPSTSPDSCEQLNEEAVNEQSLPLDKSRSEARLPQQKTLSYEQVTDLDEGFIHSQALPHVLSDSVLQTHVTKSVHPMCEGIPVSQGHHSDSFLGVLPPYAESSISQERLVSFEDHEGGGDAKSQIFHQGEQIPPIFSGWQQGKVTWGSGESFKDDSDKNAQKKPLERDDKMDTVVRTRKDQSECNDEERIVPLSGSNYSKPTVGFGGIGSSEDMKTSLPQVFGDSYQTYKKVERPETIAAAYQLKVPTTGTSEGETGIITEAVQQSQFSGRINHTGVLRSATGAQEGKIPNLFEEHTISYPAGNVNLQVPAVDQKIDSERLAEPVCSPCLLTGGVDSCAPLTTSEMWLGEKRLETDIAKDETSKYAHEATGKKLDELSNDHFNSAVTNDRNRPLQYHPGQFMEKSLIDVDYGDSASQLSAINKFLDELASSSAAHVPATTQDGIYKKLDPLNYDMSKGVLQQSAGDQVIGNLLNESSTEDFPIHLDAMGDALVQLNLHELLDIGREVDLHNISPDMAAVINLNYPPVSTTSDVEWTPGSEDVRVDENLSLGKVVEVPDEESIAIQDSDNDESKIEDSDKDEPLSDAAIAESEAIAHGLQIIKNADLEELRELGSGTFGTVYHGKWRGSDVAIKRIKNSCFTGRPSEQERMRADFWREAWILANLHHPNVVAFYGVVPDGPGGTLATVTEYMVNGSLKQVLQRKDRTIDRRKRLLIAMDAAFGMEYLHGKDIVHFDLKCENLLVNMRDAQRPICKVGDLGLSKIKHQTLVSGGVRGTLPWMAPELLNGSSSMVSEKVDVFSFGIVMWELLTGEEPYANMHYGAIIGGIVNNTLRPPVPNWCDPAWRSLMEQCWSADPSARPSFTEIANRLRAMAMSVHSKVHGNHPHVHHA